MPVIINGTTGLSGVSTVNLANGSVTQNILANGVAGTGPTIRVTRIGSAQSLSQNVSTKVLFDTIVFDTANNFSIVNSRFTPSISGYYQCNAGVQLLGTLVGSISLNKNGSADTVGLYTGTNSGNGLYNVANIIYCNGTTDYVEVYVSSNIAGSSVNYSSTNVYFSASLARAA
jgi:hypothetical protein